MTTRMRPSTGRYAPVNITATPLDTRRMRRYAKVLRTAIKASVPFLIGGGFGFEYFTGIRRSATKDLDLFVLRRDLPSLLHAMKADGFATEIVFPHWLAKIHVGADCIDVIWSSGNGVAVVDEGWFQHSVPTALLGHPVRLSPPEEMIWSKAFIMERERFDGADIAHLIRACRDRLDWQRLVDRFGVNWRVLYSHLVLFGFVYPGERGAIPSWILRDFAKRMASEAQSAPDRMCRGTLLSRAQYLTDVMHWGYVDGRLEPHGTMTREDIDRWTRAIDEQASEEVQHAHSGGG